MPSLLPLMMTLGVYGLLQKKVKVSWVLVILTSLGIIGALFGIFVV
jgi:fructoselysine and glucoselysine-specific PTS system IID component